MFNVVRVSEDDSNGSPYEGQFATSLEVRDFREADAVGMWGRRRWGIESSFHVEKNGGYELGHQMASAARRSRGALAICNPWAVGVGLDCKAGILYHTAGRWERDEKEMSMQGCKAGVFAFALLASIAVCAGEAKDGAVKVLMIGNSFTASVLREAPNLAKAEGHRLDIVQCGIGGCPLERHWANVEKSGDADFKPYFVDARFYSAGSKLPERVNVPEMLVADKWDIVTIQQASAKSAFYDTYQPYADKLIAKIRELAPQAEIVVQETWSYSPFHDRLAEWKMSSKDMYEALRKAYAQLAAKHGLRTIPTGDAVQLFRERLPVDFGALPTRAEIAALKNPNAIDLHGDVVGTSAWRQGRKGKQKDWEEVKLRNDFSHMNARGHYLQACVWIGFIFRVDPTTFKYRPESLSESDARLMRECARDALKYNSKQGGKT